MFWTVDQLKQALNQKSEIHSWIISVDHFHRRERYFLREGITKNPAIAIDQDRQAKGTDVHVRILVKKPGTDRLGEVSKRFTMAKTLTPQIDLALAAARETDIQPWELKIPSAVRAPDVKTADPKIAEDVERVTLELSSEIMAEAKAPRTSRFDSAELFVSLHDKEIHLSHGFIHRYKQSRIYAEAAFSCEEKDSNGKIISDEYLNRQWGVSLDEVKIKKLFEETADRAEKITKVVTPKNQKYAVLVDSEVLALILGDSVQHLSASSEYLKLPFKKPGEAFVPAARGDLITLSLDPLVDYGADSLAYSETGDPQVALDLVKNNTIVATATDTQYGQYLERKANTCRGAVVIQGGSASFEDLTKAEPLVLEILQFSGLFNDPNTSTFSSEIRLARLYDNVNGTVKYIKGGSVSGSLFENFQNVKFSKKTVRRNEFMDDFGSGTCFGRCYVGPEFALLNDVTVAS